eukprot:Lithocolla_globosa_v1_NODE_7027_length_1004_cov_2.261328.p2 type:complete len:114 gc:universal NODE_7027_length_1004_cov_2.261328:415-756(+)
MYIVVPSGVTAFPSLANLEKPKSPSFTRSLSLSTNITFSNLMSRCITSFLCKYCNVFASCWIIVTAKFSDIFPIFCKRSNKSPPFISSITKQTNCRQLITSRSLTTPGWSHFF